MPSTTSAPNSAAATGTPQDPRCRDCDRGNSAFDIRHRFTATYTYHLPVGKGRTLLNRGGVANVLLGGWQTNGFVTLQTGLPFTPTLQTSTTNGTGSRPDRIASGDLSSGQQHRPLVRRHCVHHAGAIHVRQLPARDILFGPGRVNFDLSLFKDFPSART